MTTYHDMSVLPARALTLTEPWATLVALGLKHYETRSWPIRFRGAVFVHAAKGMPGYARDAVLDAPFIDDLADALNAATAAQVLDALDDRRGKIIGVCTIIACHRTEDVRASLSNRELAYGDYSDGRYAFGLRDPATLADFVPCRGMLGLWTVPAIAAQQLPQAA